LPLLVQHEKIGKKKHYPMWYLALRLDKQVFSTTLLLRIGKLWYHGFFPIFFYINFLNIYFQKLEKLIDVYIFLKINIPIFH
jgi:hypothetical protein